MVKAAKRNSSQRYRRSKSAISKKLVDGSQSIIDMDNFSHHYAIDGWAAEYWMMIDGKTTQSEIAARLAKLSKLDVTTVEKEVQKVAADLLKFGLLELVED